MSYCESHRLRHHIINGCPRCLDDKRCLEIGRLLMDMEAKDAEIERLRANIEETHGVENWRFYLHQNETICIQGQYFHGGATGAMVSIYAQPIKEDNK